MYVMPTANSNIFFDEFREFVHDLKSSSSLSQYLKVISLVFAQYKKRPTDSNLDDEINDINSSLDLDMIACGLIKRLFVSVCPFYLFILH